MGESIAGKNQDFESFSSSIVKSITDKVKEIEAKDKQLNLKEVELERNTKKFDERWRELELYALEIEEDRDKVADQLRELELRSVQFKELEELRRKCEVDGKKLEERIRELDCKEEEFDGRVKGFDLRSKLLERQLKEVESNKSRIEADWKKLEERINEVDQKEKQVDGRAKGLDLLSKDLARKHQELEQKRRTIEIDSKSERIREVDSRERQLDLRSQDLERQQKELELDRRKIEADWKILDKRIVEVDCQERGLNKGLIDLKREQKELESNQRKFEAGWKKLEERFCEVSREERQLDSGLELLEIGNKDLCSQYKELQSNTKKIEADRRKLDEQLLEVELNTKITDEAVEELEVKRKDLEEKIRKLESDRREFELDREKLDDLIASLEKQKAELTEEAVSGDNGVSQCSVYVQSVEITNKACKVVEKSPIVADSNTPQLQQTATSDVQSLDLDSQHQPVISAEDPLPKKRKLSDEKSISTKNADSSSKPEEIGKDLLGVVLRQNLDFSKVRDKVMEILQSSSNPAITVLSTMKLCRPAKSSKEEVPISWCISLLKELRGFSYAIGHSTIEEAREFSMSWKANIKGEKGDHHMEETACFLLFVDSYRLGLTQTQATIPLINSVRCTKRLRNYFEQIGMPDFLPDMIRSLIRKNNRIQAVEYIEALNMRDRFPIVPILSAHLTYSNQVTDEKYDKEPNSSDCRKMSAINRRMDAVKSVIELVKQCNLEVVFPLRPLQEKLCELVRLQTSAGEENPQLKQVHNTEEEASTTSASSKIPPPPTPHSSSASSSSAPPHNRINYAPPPTPLPMVQPAQPCPYPWFGRFHPPPPPRPPPHPNQFGQQNWHGGWSSFPSSPYPGFM